MHYTTKAYGKHADKTLCILKPHHKMEVWDQFRILNTFILIKSTSVLLGRSLYTSQIQPV